MTYSLWWVLGLLAVAPLLWYAETLRAETRWTLLGRTLVIAALIYFVFALLWGDARWLGIESLGVMAYGTFYWLGSRYSVLWLALGWLLHPLWDVSLHLLGPGAHIAPDWYAVACASFDMAVAGYIIFRLKIPVEAV